MRHVAISLMFLCGLIGACTSSNGVADPTAQPPTPGTIPAPQPITTLYPPLPAAIWSQGGGSQLNDARSSAAGPDGGAAIAPRFQAAEASYIFGMVADPGGNLYGLSAGEVLSLDAAGAIRWRAIVSATGPLLLGSDGLLRIVARHLSIVMPAACSPMCCRAKSAPKTPRPDRSRSTRPARPSSNRRAARISSVRMPARRHLRACLPSSSPMTAPS